MKQHKWHKEIKAWADGAEIEYFDSRLGWFRKQHAEWFNEFEYRIKPPAKCITKDCTNHTNEGKFVGDLCLPCWDYITNGKGVHSQAYRNAQPKEPQYPFKGMCEIPYKHWVLRFYQMPNDLWYSEGMDDAWMKEMVGASKPQPKEPQYLYVWEDIGGLGMTLYKESVPSELAYRGKIKLEVDDD